MGVTGSYSRELNWGVWAGSHHDFVRILTAIERQFEPLVKRAVDNTVARAALDLKRCQDNLATQRSERESAENGFKHGLALGRIEVLEAEERDLLAAIELQKLASRSAFDFEVRVTETDGGVRVVRGSARQMAEVFEGLHYKRFSLEMRSAYPSDDLITVSASRVLGLELKVSSSDEQWARAALSVLEQEIGRQVPWWRGLLHPVSVWAVFVVFIFACFLVLIDRTSDLNASTVSSVVLPSLLLGFVGAHLVNRYVPAVEIVQTGEKPRGSKLLAVLLSMSGTIALGLFVNWIS